MLDESALKSFLTSYHACHDCPWRPEEDGGSGECPHRRDLAVLEVGVLVTDCAAKEDAVADENQRGWIAMLEAAHA